jgi:hypothetical protein
MDRLEGKLRAVDAVRHDTLHVSYYKNLLSSDGHEFKCLQKQFDLPNVESAEKAQEIAARQFESLHGLRSLRWFADVIEVERVNHEQS